MSDITLSGTAAGNTPTLMMAADLATLLHYSGVGSIRVILHRAQRDPDQYPLMADLAKAKLRIGRRTYWRRSDVYRILGLVDDISSIHGEVQP